MDLLNSLEPKILAAMRAFSVPGVALAVVKDDQIIFSRGYGSVSAGGSAPVDEHTTFAIASISKSFTGTALGMLADEGRIDWRAPVRAYLPGFELMDPCATREIQVRDLLIHNSGLGDVSGGTIWYGSDLDRDEVVRRLRYLRPEASFRSQYAYQNVMFLAAGQIIPAVTGLSWDEFVQTRIFDPLGMRDSAPNYAVGITNPKRATPYARVPYATPGAPVRDVPYRDHDNVGPAASIHSSAYDLAQYLRLHLNEGQYEGRELLRPDTAYLLHSAHSVVPIPRASNGRLNPAAPRFQSYGFGWRIFDLLGRRAVQHSGGVDGMRTVITFLPEERLGIVSLTNMEAPVSHLVTYLVIDALLGQEPFDYTAYAQATVAEEDAQMEAALRARLDSRVAGSRPSLPLEGYCGRYQNPLVDYIEVSAEGDGLALRFAHTPAFTADLEHWHHNTFRLNWRDPYVPWGLVTFDLDSSGRVRAMQLDQPNLLDVDFGEIGELKRRV